MDGTLAPAAVPLAQTCSDLPSRLPVIPVIDIFAGPGGLGEGFSRFEHPHRQLRFKLALSIERDAWAHATLRLRAYKRMFPDTVPGQYWEIVRDGKTWDQVLSQSDEAAKVAEEEARRIELSSERSVVAEVRRLIRERVNTEDPWVLIGGPPCQAYSVVGRARNSGRADYDPDTDKRQTLYVEYLQILADHAPPVFVMENVKGILSARHKAQPLFERILEDLRNPRKAIRQSSGRSSAGPASTYTIYSLVTAAVPATNEASDFVVRAERYGIPQRRHRVILLGVRDLASGSRTPSALIPAPGDTVGSTVADLPPLRSGLSGTRDGTPEWITHLRSFKARRWFKGSDPQVRATIGAAIATAESRLLHRGADFSLGREGAAVLNHSTRSHIPKDLARYMYISAYGAAHGISPTLSEIRRDLLPRHANVEAALDTGLFADRFRVQLSMQPSTTITSHIAKDGHYFIHPDPSQCRSLTVREAAELQTFPSDYFFCGPRTAQYIQVGNAVPPELARQIAAVVSALL